MADQETTYDADAAAAAAAAADASAAATDASDADASDATEATASDAAADAAADATASVAATTTSVSSANLAALASAAGVTTPVNPLSNCEPQTHEVNIAYIGGDVTNLKPADVIEISFQKWCIKWCDFLKMFYNCSNDFKVGQHLKCKYQKLIAFNHQREYCFETNKLASVLPYCLPFNLKDKVIDTWSQELKAKDNCKSIDRCSYMKLTKELNKLRTIADMYKLCKLKIESISRIELVEEIINCYANPLDKFCFNISVQINPESGGLTPILLNFKYEVQFATERQYFEQDPTTGQLTLSYNMVLCPPKCECCKPKFLCKDDCPCLPGIDDHTNLPDSKSS